MDVDADDKEKGEEGDNDEKPLYSSRRSRVKAKQEKQQRRKKVAAEADDRLETPKRPPPDKDEGKEDEEDSQTEWGRQAIKKLQHIVRKKAGQMDQRVGQVEDVLTATREEAERQAAARLAQQQRSDEAQKDELMRALAVWGLPREARCPDQATWWEQAVESAVREIALEPRNVLGVDIASVPQRVLFRTAGARNRCYDR